MINLLPPEDKRAIKREILRRYINVAGLALAILVCVEIAFSLVFLFLVVSFSDNLNDQLETTKNVANSKNLEELESKVGGINDLLLSMRVGSDSIENVSENIKKILDVLPQSVRLESFSFSPDEILLRGHADARNDLIDFADTLEKIDCLGVKCFSKTTLPVSNLLEDKDFDFSLSIDVNQTNNDNK